MSQSSDMSASTRWDLKGVWALAWRSIVYFPVALATSVLLLLGITAFFYLPIVAIVFACYGLYLWATGVILLWLSTIWLWRRFRFGRLLTKS